MPNSELAPVSVVIPCYRCTETIERTLSSVFNQTWRPRQVILIEDYSGDDTLNKLYELQKNYSNDWIQIIEMPKNCGPGSARNAGWDHATQPYICFIDADDAWHIKKIEIQLNWMINNPKSVLTGHDRLIVKDTKIIPSFEIQNENYKFRKINRTMQLFSNNFSTPTVMLRRCLPYRFAPGKRYSEDFLLWSEICLDRNDCFYISLPLALLFKSPYGDAGLSSNLWLMEKGEIDNYLRLKDSQRISYSEMLFYTSTSLAKFIKRLISISIKRLTY